MEIRYEKLNHGNFGGRSLDEFIRHQTISECWRKVDGELKLVPNEFAEDWTVEKCRENFRRNFLQAGKGLIGIRGVLQKPPCGICDS